MSLFLVAGSMFAQTFPVTSTADAPKYYTVASYNRGGVLTDADGNLQHVATNDNSYWYFTKADDNGGVHFCNLNGKYLQSNLTVGNTADVWYVLANGVNELGVSISKTNPISGGSCIDAHNYDAGVGTWAPSASDWEGTTWVFTAIDPVKDIEALLEANKENHSNNPAVGQYSTAGYKALAEAKETVKDPVAAAAAIKAFEMTKQLPLFTIDGGAKDYVVGKSIYDDNSGTLYFKATDKEDLSMLWAFDMAETTVGVTDEVVVRNLSTGNLFWGANFIKVTETNENDNAGIADDGIFLFYTNGTGYPVHAQANGSQVVRWGSYEANSGSAWKFTFVGYTYDIIDLPIVEEEPEVDPNDYTSYIKNASVAENADWEGGLSHGNGGLYKTSAESFDFTQTITLPAGQYKMTAQAAYRYAGSNDTPTSEEFEYNQIQAGAETHLAKLYAQTSTYKYEANVQNRWEGASDTNYAGDGVSTVNGKFVPNSSNAVKAWFDAGMYVNELVFNVQEDGEVKIGVAKSAKAPNGDYTNIGAWTLTRLGDAEADPKEEEPEYTEEDYDLTEGTWSDATSYIVNANLAAKDGWTASGLENDSKFDSSLRAAEFYAGWGSLERPNGHLLQEVTLPAGIYRLTGKAFFRQGNGPQDNPEKSLGYLVAGDNKVLVKTLGSANGTANNFGDGANALYADETFNSVLEFELGEETTLNIGYEVTFDEAKSWFIVGAVTLEKKITLKDNFMEQAMAYSMFGQSCQALYSLGAVQEKFYETQAVVESLYGAISAGTPVLKKDVVAAMELMENTLAEIKPIVEYFDGTFSDTKWAMYDIQDNSTANSDEVRTAFDEAVQAALNVSTVTTLAELEAKVAEMVAARREYVKNATPNTEFDMTFLITNPSFETGDMTGWTLNYSADTGAKHNSGGYATGNTHGNYLFNSWWKGVYLSQEVGEVPNGKYTLTVAMAGGDAGNDATAYVIANTDTVGVNLVSGEAFKDVKVDFLVINGRIHVATVGGNDDDTAERPLGTFNQEGYWWYKADNFRLEYAGALPLDVLLSMKKESFLARYAEFETLTETLDYSWNGINNNYYFSVQEAAMAVKDTIDNVTELAVLDEMMAAMDESVVNLSKVGVAAVDYNYFKGLLETAVGFSTMINEEECMAAYSVFEQYGGMMFGYTATTVEEIETATAELKAAYIKFVSNAVPAEGTMFDMTFAIQNPNFDKNMDGWTCVNAGHNGGAGYNNVAGIAEIALWGAESWEASITQTLNELPNGKYIVKAAWMAANGIEMTLSANEANVTVVGIGDQGGNIANDGSVVEMGQGFRGWQYVEVEGLVEDGELTIAVSSSSTTQFTWSNADAFKLYYAGAVEEEEPGDDPTGIESVESQVEAVIYDLSGRRVQKMEKGIYIVNGKKVVIK